MSLSFQSEAEPILQIRDAAVGYDQWPVLERISFDAKPGAVVGLVGENAAGKTSLLRGLFGQGAWMQAKLRWQGAPVRDLREALQSRRASWVRQDRPIFPGMTVKEAVDAVHVKDRSATRKERLDRLVDRMPELPSLFSKAMDHLSGGERAMAAMGLALVNKPRLVCLDEPAANLSTEKQAKLRELILRYVDDEDAAAVVIEHRLDMLHGAVTELVALGTSHQDIGAVNAENGSNS